ncbi:DUF6443 domain-containing protein [uncultured Aquimarina sp.]|uniref:DUF6443 domain-containing protein n=2 Tax=uncultured Aquimarina sp. TaxID=575652 RepID=UPI002634C42F|nr:DUF6443 domain-containing protein [uncultured Aquimarina sp.]
MKILQKLIYVVAVLVATVTSAQTETENYIKSTSYQTEVQDGQQSQVLESDKIISVNYFDGLGRPKQSVAVRAGGQQQNTNIIDWTGDWTSGGGNTPLFNLIGQSSENERIFDTNPFGEQSLLWKCGNDAASDADGGWNTDYIPVDKNVGYRYAVWVKRTGSQNGNTYHGTQNVNNLSGTANGNPYFVVGDTPNLNQWYLLVGIVHPHTYTGSNSGISGMYDINGNKVKNGTDYKWRNNTTTARFRNYLYYSTDTNTKQYFWNPVLTKIDGNGTPINQLIQQSKPKDIITHFEYDNYGRQAKEYLPYASEETQNGDIYTNPLAELNAFYNTPKYQNTPNPYSETIFESSPLSRPLKQAAPGKDWKADDQADTDHTIKFDWSTNGTDEVVYFKVNFHLDNTEVPILVKDGYYAANEIMVTITKDENWQPGQTYPEDYTTKEYTDKLGRVVLKRTFNQGVSHDTYYVYDDFGNLTYVIPPKVDITDEVSPEELSELCYQYKYDHRNRLVEKKIPGKGLEYIIYNKLDQPILTQDAVQRPNRHWLFTKYDPFGRVVFTGLETFPWDTTRAGLQYNLDDNTDASQYEVKTNDTSILVNGTRLYYSNTTFPGGGEIHTINYYDNYTFDHNVTNPGIVLEQTVDTNVKGLATGSKVRVLGTDDWITTVTYYDSKGRPVYVHSTNDYLNTIDIVESKLDFAGKVLETKTTHTKDGNTAIVTIDTFTYDHMGRLLTQKQQIGSYPQELIVQNNYDDLGQLENKKVGNAEQAPLQTVDYTYNVRGWLTGINDVDTIGDDLFSFKINYNTVQGFYDVPELYNGNISQTIWKTANDNTKRSYSYQYDNLNRITRANSLRGSTLMTGDSFSMWGIAYDKNGNIGRISRNGRPNGSTTRIDELYYTYSNNKLEKVREAVTSVHKNEGFIDGTNTNNDYVYDANGNMTIDRNKGITGITYNHLNLPTAVAINDQTQSNTGNISYIYSATGTKLKKIVSGGSSLTTEYAGNYIYENGKLQFFNTSEGYVEPWYKGIGEYQTIIDYNYVYQLKDHLGNIRISYSDKDKDGKIDVLRNNADVDGDGDYAQEIMQEKNYYPFGLQHKGYNNTITGRKHNYGFGGKEENSELSLEWLDFGARNYDASLGRWMNPDSMAEMFYGWTPYKYSMNNPILLSDPDGNCEFCKKFLNSAFNTYKSTLSDTYEGAKKLVTSPIQTVKAAASNHFTVGGMMQATDTALNVVSGGMHEIAKDVARVAISDEPVATAGQVYGERAANLTVEVAAVATAEAGGKLIGPLTKSASKSVAPKSVSENLVSVRHHTSNTAAKAIKKRGEITASRPAQGLPSGVDVEVAPFGPASSAASDLGAYQSGAFLEFQVPGTSLTPTPMVNPARNSARIITNGENLSLPSKVKKRRVITN